MKIKPVFLIIIFFLITGSPVVFGESGRDIELEALDIEFDLAENFLYGRGEVFFRYGELILSCQEILVDLNRGFLKASGEVLLREDGEEIKGEELSFYFQEERGEITLPRTEYDNLSLWGELLRLSPDFSEISRANLTPCIKPDPHYRVSSRRVVISPEGLIEAYHVTVRWGDVPFFYLPYYVARYEDGTISSPFPTPSVGYDSERGAFLGLTFDHQVTDKLKGEYYFETTSRDYLYFGEFSFKHNPRENLEGDIELVIEQGEPLEFEAYYGYETSPHLDLLGGAGRKDGSYYLHTGWNYSGTKIDHNVVLDWEPLGTFLFRARGAIDYGNFSLSADWQRYRDRFYGDLGWRESDFDWWLRYRQGTDVERLPQTRITFRGGTLGTVFFDWGRFEEGDVSSPRIGSQYTLNRSLGPIGFRLRLEGYDYIQYGAQGSIETRFSWSGDWENHEFGLGILLRETGGETPFDFDIIEKKQQVFGEWTAKFNENNRFPVYTAGLEIEYSFISNELEKMNGMFKKEQDCYYWSLEADPIRSEFEFTIGTPF